MGPTASLVTVRPVMSLASGGPPTVTSPVYATFSPSLRAPTFLTKRNRRGALPPRGQRWQRPTRGHGQRGAIAPAGQPGQQVAGLPVHGQLRPGGLVRAD